MGTRSRSPAGRVRQADEAAYRWTSPSPSRSTRSTVSMTSPALVGSASMPLAGRAVASAVGPWPWRSPGRTGRPRRGPRLAQAPRADHRSVVVDLTVVVEQQPQQAAVRQLVPPRRQVEHGHPVVAGGGSRIVDHHEGVRVRRQQRASSAARLAGETRIRRGPTASESCPEQGVGSHFTQSHSASACSEESTAMANGTSQPSRRPPPGERPRPPPTSIRSNAGRVHHAGRLGCIRWSARPRCTGGRGRWATRRIGAGVRRQAPRSGCCTRDALGGNAGW